MRKLKLAVIAIVLCFALVPTLVKAQGNPLKNIPISEPSGVFQNATFSIDDFVIINNTIYVTSTLRATVGTQNYSEQSVEVPISILTTSCNTLSMVIGSVPVNIANKEFTISPFTVIVSEKKSNDNRLNNALCSIAKAYESNASLNTIVAKLKAAIRAY